MAKKKFHFKIDKDSITLSTDALFGLFSGLFFQNFVFLAEEGALGYPTGLNWKDSCLWGLHLCGGFLPIFSKNVRGNFPP